jgi:hypothetical protein
VRRCICIDDDLTKEERETKKEVKSVGQRRERWRKKGENRIQENTDKRGLV